MMEHGNRGAAALHTRATAGAGSDIAAVVQPVIDATQTKVELPTSNPARHMLRLPPRPTIRPSIRLVRRPLPRPTRRPHFRPPLTSRRTSRPTRPPIPRHIRRQVRQPRHRLLQPHGAGKCVQVTTAVAPGPIPSPVASSGRLWRTVSTLRRVAAASRGVVHAQPAAIEVFETIAGDDRSRSVHSCTPPPPLEGSCSCSNKPI